MHDRNGTPFVAILHALAKRLKPFTTHAHGCAQLRGGACSCGLSGLRDQADRIVPPKFACARCGGELAWRGTNAGLEVRPCNQCTATARAHVRGDVARYELTTSGREIAEGGHASDLKAFRASLSEFVALTVHRAVLDPLCAGVPREEIVALDNTTAALERLLFPTKENR